MIPRIIHYCWFGRKPKSESIEKCIGSWKKFAYDYRIVEWNEDNFDVYSCKYSADAYNSGKYAFVSDFARLKVLFEYGGFYLDTDVELIRPLDDLRNNTAFMGFESSIMVSPGAIIGAQSRNNFIGELLDKYSTYIFEQNGRMNLTTIGEYTTAQLLKKGLKLDGRFQTAGGVTVYPSEYFCPYDYYSGSLNITPATYSIHHYNASWKEPSPAGKMRVRRIKLLMKLYLLSLLGGQNLFSVRCILG